MKSRHDHDIAIIGIGLNVGEFTNLNDYWKAICDKTDCIKVFPDNRRIDTDYYLARMGKDYSNANYLKGAYLEAIDEFDYKFFNIPLNEAKAMDPNQRLMLQVAYKAVENAGYGGGQLDGTRTGVYIGYNASLQVYSSLLKNLEIDKINNAFTGNTSSVIAGRIAHFLNIHGPTMMIDSACATSLTALHIACNGIRNGDCDAAIVGAVSLKMMLLSDDMENIGTTSKDLRTRTFDNSSIGTGPGEGVIAIFIKDYDAAVKDKDAIYAVIKGSSINHNGHTIGITSTSVSAQEDVIVSAWEKAGIDVNDIRYIEAHGTGTKLGDPTEIQALKRAFSKYTDHKQFCAIGSVKSNVGHLKSCAGLAGLVKCVLAITNRELLPTNHFELPNHQINFVNSPVYVNDEVRTWNSSTNTYCCGVSSFGINGSNAHVVLCNSNDSEEKYQQNENQAYLFLLSAKTKTALYRLLHLYSEYLQNNCINIDELCYNLQVGRGHYKHRIGIITYSVNELTNKINKVLWNGLESDLLSQWIRYARVVKSVKNQCEEKSDECRSRENITDYLNSYCMGDKPDWYKTDMIHKMKKMHLPEYSYDPHRCWLFSKVGPEMYHFYESDLVIKDIKSDRMSLDEKRKEFIVTNSLEQEDMVLHSLDCTKINFKQFGRIDECSDESNICLYISIESLTETSIKEFYDFLSNLNKIKRFHKISKIFVIIHETIGIDNNDDMDMNLPFILGMLKAAIWEYASIQFKAICIDDESSTVSLQKEIYSNETEFFVRYRKNQRYVEIQKKKVLTKNRTLVYSEDGVYIIVGGLGGVGLKLAHTLVKKGCANIALISRRDCSNFRNFNVVENGIYQKLREIEKLGCHIECISADVTDYERMKRIRDELIDKYGSIRGVIHCATSNEETRFGIHSFDDFKCHMEAKVEGVKVLEELTRNMELNFFVLFSSGICITGGIGCSSYIAGNMYLTEFAKKYSNLKNKLVSIQWPAWFHTGLAEYNNVVEDRELFFPIKPVCAFTALEEIIENGCSHITVGKLNHKSHIWKFQSILPFHFEQDNDNQLRKEMMPQKISKEQSDDLVIEKYNGNNIIEILKRIWSKELGNPNIELNDNYFELGGDSIIMLHIINRINSTFNVELQMKDFVRNPTLKDINQYLDSIVKHSQMIENDKVESSENRNCRRKNYPVTSAQKRMLIQSKLSQDSVAYNLFEAVHISGNLDVKRFIEAVRTTILENEVFYTKILLNEDGIEQVIDHCVIEIPFILFKNGNLDEYINQFVKPFYLDESPLIRCVILQTAKNEHIFLYDVHHVAFDGVSRRVFIDSIVSLYQGEMVSFDSPYKDYAIWQDSIKKTKEYNDQRNYWLGRLEPVVEDVMNIESKDYDERACRRVIFTVNRDTTDQIDTYIAKKKQTLFTFLLSVLYVALYEKTRKEVYSIATPVECRTNQEFMRTIGMFVNTIVLANTIYPKETFEEFSSKVFNNTMSDLSNVEYQYEDLMTELKLNRNRNSTLFDTMLTLQDKQFAREVVVEGLEITTLPIMTHFTKFRHNIEVVRINNELEFHIDYSTELSKENKIDRLKNNIIKVIDIVLNNNKISCDDLIKKIHTKNNDSYQTELHFNFK